MTDDELPEVVIRINEMSPAERAEKVRQIQDLLKRRPWKQRTPRGWECPRCQRIYGPKATECWVCNARK